MAEGRAALANRGEHDLAVVPQLPADKLQHAAVHGYAGFFGVVIAGFMLWGYPASMYLESTITPWGQFIGAMIMFGLLGFMPAWIVAGILKKMNLLRIPHEVELAGLDLAEYHGRYLDEAQVVEAEQEEARSRGLIS